MKRDSSFLYLVSAGATTPVPWVSDAPDFSGFSEPTLGVLQSSWQAFLDSGEALEVIPDPPPPSPEPDWVGFNVAMRGCTSFQTWFGFLSPLDQQAVVATSVNGNAPALQVAITMAAASVPYSPASGEEWAGIAATYGIPLTL